MSKKSKNPQEEIRDSVQKIWLAGLGALAATEEEGVKIFNSLVEKGEAYEARGKKEAAKARKELRESLISTAPVFGAKPFFMSDEFTLVDCAIAPLLWRLPVLGVEIPASAKGFHNYAKQLFERQSFNQSLSEAEREMRG
jgi:glutathione S-transferase